MECCNFTAPLSNYITAIRYPAMHTIKLRVVGFLILFLITNTTSGQNTVFEQSGGKETSTYFETIAYYRQLDLQSPKVTMMETGSTDAGLPLHLVLVSNSGNANVSDWKNENKIIIMVLNGIHPGEPDGIDASQMLLGDIVSGRVNLPENVCLGIIPVYNIGGSLNRSPYSRVNQQGPKEYGFRGNAQNLDLNRDFIKADSRNARSFAKAFHYLQPNILIDNHVSDGADFQHVFTLITSQYNKMGKHLGDYVRKAFEPSLYKSMDQKGWKLFPYVNFNSYDLTKGMTQFYESPRYSSGYATLFQTIGFIPETHMLKPYHQRVQSTYDFMLTVIEQSSAQAFQLHEARRKESASLQNARVWPLTWKPDSSRKDKLRFLGYERDTVISKVTRLPIMQYNRNRPFDIEIDFFSYFDSASTVKVPEYYIIPQGWHRVIDRLKENNVQWSRFLRDTTVKVKVYHIEDFRAPARPYEGHFRLGNIIVRESEQNLNFRQGDYLIPLQQSAKRYLLETLEPEGEDSFLAWNYFDAILGQKEGYSAYRWEQVAEKWLDDHPELQKELDEKLRSDPEFAKNSAAILNWVYVRTPYYEPAHKRYPVYRVF